MDTIPDKHDKFAILQKGMEFSYCSPYCTLITPILGLFSPYCTCLHFRNDMLQADLRPASQIPGCGLLVAVLY